MNCYEYGGREQVSVETVHDDHIYNRPSWEELRKNLSPGKGFRRRGEITLHHSKPVHAHDTCSASVETRPP